MMYGRDEGIHKAKQSLYDLPSQGMPVDGHLGARWIDQLCTYGKGYIAFIQHVSSNFVEPILGINHDGSFLNAVVAELLHTTQSEGEDMFRKAYHDAAPVENPNLQVLVELHQCTIGGRFTRKGYMHDLTINETAQFCLHNLG